MDSNQVEVPELTLDSSGVVWKQVQKVLFASTLAVGTSFAVNAQPITAVNVYKAPLCKKCQSKKIDSKKKEESPYSKKFYFRGISLTPGGFLAGEGVWRSRNVMSDIASSFSAIPTHNLPQAYMNETRLSGRQSRLSLLAEGEICPDVLVSGYVETDFLGNGTGNSNESNSFDLRIRQAYANLDWNNTGWHFLGGQTWSLLTTNTAGITPQSPALPPTIEAQYVVGFAWKRQGSFRLTKKFTDMFWAAVAVENPQTTFGGSPACAAAPAGSGAVFYGVSNIFCSAPGTGTLPSLLNYSFNRAPDVIGKVAFRPDISDHNIELEGFVLYRDFFDRVYFTNGLKTNTSTSGVSGGFNAFVEVIPKKLDFQGNVISGRGIGSYGSGQLPDVTFASNGSLRPIRETAFMAGLTLHATPCLDLYVFGGQEKQKARYFYIGPSTNNFFGFGIPTANNSGCSIEGGTCAGNTRQLWQVTPGLWDKVYEGPYGQVKAGLQYSYTKRTLFPGTNSHTNNIVTGQFVGGRTNDHMVFFSFRYYPFLTPPAVSPATYIK